MVTVTPRADEIAAGVWAVSAWAAAAIVSVRASATSGELLADSGMIK